MTEFNRVCGSTAYCLVAIHECDTDFDFDTIKGEDRATLIKPTASEPSDPCLSTHIEFDNNGDGRILPPFPIISSFEPDTLSSQTTVHLVAVPSLAGATAGTTTTTTTTTTRWPHEPPDPSTTPVQACHRAGPRRHPAVDRPHAHRCCSSWCPSPSTSATCAPSAAACRPTPMPSPSTPCRPSPATARSTPCRWPSPRRTPVPCGTTSPPHSPPTKSRSGSGTSRPRSCARARSTSSTPDRTPARHCPIPPDRLATRTRCRSISGRPSRCTSTSAARSVRSSASVSPWPGPGPWGSWDRSSPASGSTTPRLTARPGIPPRRR